MVFSFRGVISFGVSRGSDYVLDRVFSLVDYDVIIFQVNYFRFIFGDNYLVYFYVEIKCYIFQGRKSYFQRSIDFEYLKVVLVCLLWWLVVISWVRGFFVIWGECRFEDFFIFGGFGGYAFLGGACGDLVFDVILCFAQVYFGRGQ